MHLDVLKLLPIKIGKGAKTNTLCFAWAISPFLARGGLRRLRVTQCGNTCAGDELLMESQLSEQQKVFDYCVEHVEDKPDMP